MAGVWAVDCEDLGVQLFDRAQDAFGELWGELQGSTSGEWWLTAPFTNDGHGHVHSPQERYQHHNGSETVLFLVGAKRKKKGQYSYEVDPKLREIHEKRLHVEEA